MCTFKKYHCTQWARAGGNFQVPIDKCGKIHASPKQWSMCCPQTYISTATSAHCFSRFPPISLLLWVLVTTWREPYGSSNAPKALSLRSCGCMSCWRWPWFYCCSLLPTSLLLWVLVTTWCEPYGSSNASKPSLL